MSEAIQRWVLFVLGISMVVLITVNSLGRYLLNEGVVWAEELTRLLFVWGCFIAITIGFYRRAHIGFDLLAQKSAWGAKVARIATSLSLLLVGSVVVWYGIEFVNKVGRFPLPATDLPVWMLYVAGVFAGAAWILIALWQLLQEARNAVAGAAGKGEAN